MRKHLTLGGLFFLQLTAPGLWTVSLSNVLKSHGLEPYIPYGFACSALAAFVAPLIIGALADTEISPVRLLRWLNWASAVSLAVAYVAIDRGWGGAAVIAALLVQALCASPCLGLATTIALAALAEPSRQFGLLRVWGTVGWALGGWAVSFLLAADASPLSGYAAAAVMAALGFYTHLVPDAPAPGAGGGRRSWFQMLGLDAFSLLRQRDHRIVFVTTALLTIPLAAFYPYTPLHLTALGASHPTATMSIGQISEVAGLVALGSLWRRVRLKWIFLAGLAMSVLRYAFFTLDARGWLIAGVALHGACYSLFYVTGQIYVAERIERGMQARAQALLTLTVSGVGNLIGYLGTGAWFAVCGGGAAPHWRVFWLGLCAVVTAAAAYFAIAYKGVGAEKHRALAEQAGV